MKLYTEEQMKRCFNDAQMQWANYRFMYQDFDEYKIACSLTPIELPSDEKIEERIKNFIRYDDIFFKAGVNWILEQIKKQADGK